MKKFTLLTIMSVLFYALTTAQSTVVINTGTAGAPAYNAGPIYRSSAGSAYDASRYAYLYDAAELAAVGITPGTTITELGWVKNNNATSTGGGIFRIFMKNSSATSFSLATEAWANLNAGTTLVYENLNQVVPATQAPNYITYTLNTPFVYTGGSLEISTEWDINQVTGNASTGTFDWLWSTVPDRIYGTGNTTLAGCNTLSSTTNSISDITDRRPFIQISFLSQPGLNASLTNLSVGAVPCAGSVTVTANLSNVGTIDIDSARIDWTINGVPQTAFMYYGPLAQFASANITLGSFNIVPQTAYNIVAFISDVNGAGPDISQTTDTTSLSGLQAGLSGNYTINSALPLNGVNFPSFTSLANALNANGMCGPVVVDVAPGSGPYTEQVAFTQITGSSAVNTLTINGNGNTLQFAPTAAAKFVLHLNGTDYTTIDNLTIVGTDATNGIGVLLSNDATYDTIRNCTINLAAVTSTSTTNSAGIAASASITSPATGGTTASFCVFEGNTILGGATGGPYYGFALYGTTGSVGCVSNKIINNTITDFFNNGIRCNLTLGTEVTGNSLSRPTLTTAGTLEGIYFTGLANPKARIDKNRIFNSHGGNPASTSIVYAIDISSDGGSVTQPIDVYNNAVYNINNNGTAYGIYASGAFYSNYYHNSISLDNVAATGTTTTRAIYLLGTYDTVNVYNNVVSVTRGGAGVMYGLYYTSLPANLKSDNNVVYINNATATRYFGYNGANQLTYNDWLLTSGGRDAASIDANPLYTNANNGDLTPSSAAVNNIGLDLTSLVAEDILGTPRSSTPDPGAFEFTPQADDAGLTQVVTDPCPDTNDLWVRVQNFGVATLNSVTVYTNINGTPTANSGATYAVNLPSGADTLLNVGQVTFLAGTSYSIQAFTAQPNGAADANNANDTLVQNINLSLVGNYTINSAVATGGFNFQSFTDAATTLNANGICGPVVLTVVPGSGPYTNQQISLDQVTGVSATNTITIKGNYEPFNFLSTNTNQRWGIRLNGTSYVTIDSMLINGLGTTTTEYAFGIMLTGASSFNNITNNRINLDTVTTSTNFAGIVVTNSNTSAISAGADCNFNLIEGNTVVGGYYGITNMGTSTSVVKLGNIIRNNNLQRFHFYGIYQANQDSSEVSGNNTESRVGPNTTSYGLYFSYSFRTNVNKNRVVTQASGTNYGIYLTNSNGFAGTNVVVSNNMISCLGGTGATYGIYPFNCNGVDIFHNNILSTGGSSTAGRALYLNSSSTGNFGNIRIYNNIIVNTGPGYAVEISNASHTLGYVTAMDRNNILASGAVLGRYNNINNATLADWTAASLRDSNSVSVDPLFFSNTNLHVQQNLLNDRGELGLGINDDFDGDIRCPLPGCAGNTLRPDIGADEFLGVPVTVDLAMEALLQPTAQACFSNTENVTVLIRNNHSETIYFAQEPATINVSVAGPNPFTFTPIVINTDSLQPDSVLVVPVAVGYDMSAPGVYTFTAVVTEQNDAVNFNDTLVASVNFNIGTINNTYKQICEGASYELKMNGISGPVQWQSYDANTMTWINETGTGNTNVNYTVSPAVTTIYRALVCGTYPSANDTIEVAVTPLPVAVGDTICGPGSVTLSASVPSGSLKWYADATTTTALGSGSVYTATISATDTFYVENTDGGAGTETVGPFDPTIGTTSASTIAIGTQRMFFDVLQDATIISVDIFPTAAVGSSGSIVIRNNTQTIVATVPYVTTVTGGQRQTIPMGVFLTAGTGYEIGQGTAINLNRNTTGAVYPYTSSSVVITGNTFNPVYYYFYYNWQISSGCSSPRVPVVAVVSPAPVVNLGPAVTQCEGTVTLDAANAGSTYNWSTTESTQTITVNATNTYTVTVTNADNCSASSSVSVTIADYPVVNLGADVEQCGGSVTLDADNAGATFNWNQGDNTQTISVTTSGTYAVTVTNSFNCATSDSVQVAIFDLPVVNLGADVEQCGGSVTLDAANNGATFLWNDASTGQTLTATQTGEYAVVVTDANNCSNTDTVQVTIFELPALDLGNDISQCGGNVILDVTTTGVSYLWNDNSTDASLNVTQSGLYSVTLTDANNCQSSDNITVTIFVEPTVSLGADVEQCGGSVTLDAQNLGSTIIWSTGASTSSISVSASGAYAVTVTDNNNCSATDTVDVTIFDLPVVSLNAGADTVCTTAANVTLSGTPAGGTFSGAGVSGSVFSPATAGVGTQTITYTYTDNNNCSNSAADVVEVILCVGLDGAPQPIRYSVYPNPNKGAFNIAFNALPAEALTAEIYSAEGRVVYRSTITQAVTPVDVTGLAAGIYTVKLTGTQAAATTRLVIE